MAMTDMDRLVQELLDDIKRSPLGIHGTLRKADIWVGSYSRWRRGDFLPSVPTIAKLRKALDEIHREHADAQAPHRKGREV